MAKPNSLTYRLFPILAGSEKLLKHADSGFQRFQKIVTGAITCADPITCFGSRPIDRISRRSSVHGIVTRALDNGRRRSFTKEVSIKAAAGLPEAKDRPGWTSSRKTLRPAGVSRSSQAHSLSVRYGPLQFNEGHPHLVICSMRVLQYVNVFEHDDASPEQHNLPGLAAPFLSGVRSLSSVPLFTIARCARRRVEARFDSVFGPLAAIAAG